MILFENAFSRFESKLILSDMDIWLFLFQKSNRELKIIYKTQNCNSKKQINMTVHRI